MRRALTVAFVAAAGASTSDLQRARQQVPRSDVVGEGHVGMTVKLNKALRAMKDVQLLDCEQFSIEDLTALQRKLYKVRDPALEQIYRESTDDGRRMGAFGKQAESLQELEGLWAKELEMLKAYPHLTGASRDVKCHEAILWMVHHVPRAIQAALRKELILPTLPERERRGPQDVDVFQPPGGLGCDTAHAVQTKAENNEYVEWPSELTYSATAHGAFPFWDNGGPGCSNCDPSVSGSAQLKVQYSDKLRSEILLHSSCGDMSWAGSGAPNKSPCNHIFTPDLGAFIYTPKNSLEPEADGKFCCRSVPAGSNTFTGAVPRDWMKQGKYAGTHENFKGDHYSGPIKMYTFGGGGGGPLSFWYYTKPDGTAVQQGEGCYQPKGKKPEACQKMMPIVLYHDFDPATFKNASFTQADFTVPDICKNTKNSCSIPGDNVAEIVV